VQSPNDIEKKRKNTILAAFFILAKNGYIDGNRFTLNRSLLDLTVKHYLEDLQSMKKRYGLEDNAQPQKVAGFMAVAIMKFRPVLPQNGSDENLFYGDENEILTAFHGLCVCAEGSDGKIDQRVITNFFSKPEIQEWLENLLYLLKLGYYTPEGLMQVFDTIIRFPK